MTHTIALFRFIRLSAQMRTIRKEIDDMSLPARRRLATVTVREIANAAKLDRPELYGSDRDPRFHLWGEGTSIGMERVKSDNPELKLRGVALWIAVAFYESRDTGFGELDGLHRRVMRLTRELRGYLAEPQQKSQARGKISAIA